MMIKIEVMVVDRDKQVIEDAGLAMDHMSREIADISSRPMQLREILLQSLLRTANVEHRILGSHLQYIILLAIPVSAPLSFGKGFVGNRLVSTLFDWVMNTMAVDRRLFLNLHILINTLGAGHSLE